MKSVSFAITEEQLREWQFCVRKKITENKLYFAFRSLRVRGLKYFTVLFSHSVPVPLAQSLFDPLNLGQQHCHNWAGEG